MRRQSVSGFLFTGNAGNPITGCERSGGNLYSDFGSSDQNVEGFFDLSGLPIPNGASTRSINASKVLDPVVVGGSFSL